MYVPINIQSFTEHPCPASSATTAPKVQRLTSRRCYLLNMPLKVADFGLGLSDMHLRGSTGIPVRVNAIAPGVYESEMTFEDINSEELVNRVGCGIQAVPSKRAGRLVGTYYLYAYLSHCSLFAHLVETPGDGGDSGILGITCWVLYKRAGDCYRRGIYWCQSFYEVNAINVLSDAVSIS